MTKPPQKKEITDIMAPYEILKISYLNALNDEWHKFIDEAPIEEIIKSHEKPNHAPMSPYEFNKLAKALRSMLKGEE